jgi:hypothetical protein
MQLPRGTFRSIRKGLSIPVLLQEMETARFSGYCTISWGREVSTLVLDKGHVVLAEYRDLGGAGALNSIAGLGDQSVDAQLNDLSVTQLSLASEFNKPYAIKDSQRSGVTFGKLPALQTTEAKIAAPSTHPPTPSRTPNPGSPGREVPPAERSIDVLEGDALGIVNKDLAALDRMDLDRITEQIRDTCKITVERLDLGHLMNEKPRK